MVIAILQTYYLIGDLASSYFCNREKQVEEMPNKLQSAEENISYQDQKITELSTKLEWERKENQTLWNQVESLTMAIHHEGNSMRLSAVRERANVQEGYTLRNKLGQQLEELQRQSAQLKGQEELLLHQHRDTTPLSSHNALGPWVDSSSSVSRCGFCQSDSGLPHSKDKILNV